LFDTGQLHLANIPSAPQAPAASMVIDG